MKANMAAVPRKRPTKDEVETRETLNGFDISQLRDLRNLIRTDIERVSYWSRLLESRMEQISAGKSLDPVPERIISVTAEQTARFSEAVSYKGKMPDPEGSWSERVAHPSEMQIKQFVTQSTRGVQQLEAYRAFLKARLDLVTDELIQRYKQNPALIDTLLPERRP